ncbi:hypothetical protein DL98DRAFT_638521 [Cadophora sp. DSE1049]|nr:hypothetical protein DL98DRAFT_638521 [Cadophora sp. DSE1049]
MRYWKLAIRNYFMKLQRRNPPAMDSNDTTVLTRKRPNTKKIIISVSAWLGLSIVTTITSVVYFGCSLLALTQDSQRMRLSYAGIFTAQAFAILAGTLVAGGSQYSIPPNELDSAIVWIQGMNSTIDSLVELSSRSSSAGSLEKIERDTKREKQQFANYLLPTPWRLPSMYSSWVSSWLKLLALDIGGILSLIASSMPDTVPCLVKCFTWAVAASYIVLIFFIGRRIQWYERLGSSARRIKKLCEHRDAEKNMGKWHQLEWWVEALLR